MNPRAYIDPDPTETPRRVPPRKSARGQTYRPAAGLSTAEAVQFDVGRLRSILTRPAVSGVLFLLLLYSLWRVPSADTSDCSVVGWTLPGLKVGKAETFSPITVYLIRDGEGFRVEDIEKSSTQGLIEALEKDPNDVVRGYLNYERHASGLYDITSFRDEYAIEIRPFRGAALTTERAARARAAFVGWIGSKRGANLPGVAEALSDVAPSRRALNWPGIANSALALVGWTLFVVSLGWVPGAIRGWRRRRAEHLLSLGKCPRCKYEIYGLKDGVCPECGKPLPAQF